MSLEIIVPALIALIPTIIGWIASIAVIKQQINTLEKTVDKHNKVIERVYRLEQAFKDFIIMHKDNHPDLDK